MLYIDVMSYGSFNLKVFVKLLSIAEPDQWEGDARRPGEGTDQFLEVTFPTDRVNHPGEHKVLGVRWDILNDQPQNSSRKATGLRPTKRNVSLIGQIYDP